MSQYKVGDCDVKQIQDVMLQIMIEIDKICRKNNIRYILSGGTMLGAVRHHGFIPWDDDMDVVMMREDYDKFVKIANFELPEKFRLICYENTKEHPFNFGKIRAVNTVMKERRFENLPINHGIWVDIFPMDYIRKSDYLIRLRFINLLSAARFHKLGMPVYRRNILKRILLTPFLICNIEQINKLLDKQLKYYYKKSDKLLDICLCKRSVAKYVFDRSLFTDVIEVPFEGHMFFIPRDYDSYLKIRYGDYMTLPPAEDQKTSHEIVEVKI